MWRRPQRPISTKFRHFPKTNQVVIRISRAIRTSQMRKFPISLITVATENRTQPRDQQPWGAFTDCTANEASRRHLRRPVTQETACHSTQRAYHRGATVGSRYSRPQRQLTGAHRPHRPSSTRQVYQASSSVRSIAPENTRRALSRIASRHSS